MEELKSFDFYELWREKIVTHMTLVDKLPEGKLYFWHDLSCAVWVFTGLNSLIIAYYHFETRAKISERVGVWVQSLMDKNNSTDARELPGHVVYGCIADPDAKELQVRWCRFGDWSGIHLAYNHGNLPQHRDQVPDTWTDSDKTRIINLLRERESKT